MEYCSKIILLAPTNIIEICAVQFDGAGIVTTEGEYDFNEAYFKFRSYKLKPLCFER
jgi:hypothetical protein